MRAHFDLLGTHRPVIVLTPESDADKILLAAWMRFDANTISLSVRRFENGRIDTVTLEASSAQ